MNLKISSTGVRWRISLREARLLESGQALEEILPLPDGSLKLELCLSEDMETPAALVWRAGEARATVRHKDFMDLLQAKPARDSAIAAPFAGAEGEQAEFSLEIDLFSQKEGKGGRK